MRMCDLLYSFQVGLPTMIRSSSSDIDTEPPQNIHDADFNMDTQVLPSPRPLSKVTNVSYMIIKSTMAFTLGRIIEASNSVQRISYDETLALDGELRETYHALPTMLQMKSIEESASDDWKIICMRYHVSILYYRCLCVLHRKFLVLARENPRYIDSRRTCIDSAMTLLCYQQILHYESQPGGRLQGFGWYSSSSYNASAFLLAATLVSLDLVYSAESDSGNKPNLDVELWGKSRVQEMTEALENCRKIWFELKDHSMEAYKASNLIEIMLRKVQHIYEEAGHRHRSSYPKFTGSLRVDEEKPEHTAAMTLGMLSSGALGQNIAHSQYPTYPSAVNVSVGEANQPMDANVNTYMYNNSQTSLPFFTSPGGLDFPTADFDWVSIIVC